MSKKIFSLLLVVALLVGCLTSCNFIKNIFNKNKVEENPNTDVEQVVYKHACFTEFSVRAAADTIGAEPRPDSLEKSPREIP